MNCRFRQHTQHITQVYHDDNVGARCRRDRVRVNGACGRNAVRRSVGLPMRWPRRRRRTTFRFPPGRVVAGRGKARRGGKFIAAVTGCGRPSSSAAAVTRHAAGKTRAPRRARRRVSRPSH